MKGKYKIRVQNKTLRYDLEIKRNISIIKGDSATGKTKLVEMIQEYYENGDDSGIELICKVNCGVLYGKSWKSQLNILTNSIIFIDEGNRFVASKDFAEAVQKSDNYFVIVTREGLPMLPYSVEEIYGIRNSGKYGYLKKTYNEFYHIYSKEIYTLPFRPKLLITEDSNSGFQFFQHICDNSNITCISAGGKSNLFTRLLNNENAEILVVADGAAIGSEMENIDLNGHIC